MSGGSVFSFIPTIENIIDFAIEMATTDVASLALPLGGANSNLLNLFWTKLRPRGKLEKIVEFLYVSPLASYNVNIFYNHGKIIKTRKLILLKDCRPNFTPYLSFTSFSPSILFLF